MNEVSKNGILPSLTASDVTLMLQSRELRCSEKFGAGKRCRLHICTKEMVGCGLCLMVEVPSVGEICTR